MGLTARRARHGPPATNRGLSGRRELSAIGSTCKTGYPFPYLGEEIYQGCGQGVVPLTAPGAAPLRSFLGDRNNANNLYNSDSDIEIVTVDRQVTDGLWLAVGCGCLRCPKPIRGALACAGPWS